MTMPQPPTQSDDQPSPPDSPVKSHTPPEAFGELCAQIGLEIDPAELARHEQFVSLLLDANTRTNLTGAKESNEVWTRHVFDALTLISVLDSVDGPLDILDIGSGGGFPAIPLAIARPDDRFTLVDSTGKKCDFLDSVIADMGLTNVEVLRGRAEKLGQHGAIREDRDGERQRGGPLRGRFDVVTCRAVGRVAVAAELCVPFAKEGGLVVLVKGAQAEDELAEAKKALHMLHAASAGVIATPTGRLVVLEKLRATPRMYPRLDGEPKRSPLGIGAKQDESRR